jgi:5-methylthioadenosine/S-adenosylhomocysteine deaminase
MLPEESDKLAAPNEVDVIINGGTVVTMDAQRQIISNGAVAIRGQTVVGVGKRDQLSRDFRAARTIEAHDRLIIPGLIDAHNHPVHYMTKGAIDDLPFQYRFKNIIVPYERTISEEETYLNACGTFVEMIANGTTCFNDPGSIYGNGVGRAAQDVGIRGTLAYESSDVGGGLEGGPDEGNWRGVVEKSEMLMETWQGAADGRLRVWYALNNPHRVSDELCVAIRDRAATRGIGIHGHMSISRQNALNPEFRSPVRRYHRLGLLNPNLYLIHFIHIIPEDVELLVSHGVKGVHCPGTSMHGAWGAISHGTIPELIAAGMVMGLGSDAGAVSRFLDMVRHMYIAAAGHKDARLDATIMGCYKAFEMATIDGARAMLWDHEIGSIEVGKKADISILDISAPEYHPNPHRNPIANLVYSGSGASTQTVIIDGKIIMEDRQFKTVDVPALMSAVDKAATRLLGHQPSTLSKWPVN